MSRILPSHVVIPRQSCAAIGISVSDMEVTGNTREDGRRECASARPFYIWDTASSGILESVTCGYVNGAGAAVISGSLQSLREFSGAVCPPSILHASFMWMETGNKLSTVRGLCVHLYKYYSIHICSQNHLGSLFIYFIILYVFLFACTCVFHMPVFCPRGQKRLSDALALDLQC